MKKRKVFILGFSVLALASCGAGNTTEGDQEYTYRAYMTGSPTNWNPHTWEDSGAESVTAYSEIGFCDFTYDPEVEGGYKVVFEMATNIEDKTTDTSVVTDEFKEKWGIEDGDEGRVWKITLNPNAKFASGKAINANTYVDSMKLLLDSNMKNYRANNYYSGDTSIVHAFNYYNSGEKALTNVFDIPTWGVNVESTVYLDWDNSPVFSDVFGYTKEQIAASSYASWFENSDGDNLLTKYVSATQFTDAVKAEYKSTDIYEYLISAGCSEEEAIGYVTSQNVTYNNIDFSDVGLYADGDYTLYYITETEVSLFNFEVSVSSLWLVNPELYETTIDKTQALWTTTYGTSADKYDSFGPYKLTSFEKDKQFVFNRNENWYGWTDGKHEGQYQTTKIVVDIKTQPTALLAFEKGELDEVDLTQADLSRYGYSDYLHHTPQTYTMRLVFDHNLESLKALEDSANNGKNKRILAQYDFRKALSLAIDRTSFNAEGTAGNEPAYALLNSLYYYDVENDPSSIYRNTDVAKKVVTDLYGMEYGEGKTYATLDDAYNAVTGLDVEEAKKLFTSAYNAAIADGTYTNGQEIELEIGLYDATTATSTTQIQLLNKYVATATQGTPLEGKITFKGKSFTGDETRYDAIGAGHVEIANCAWGGAAFYPFQCMRVYCDEDYVSVNEADSFTPSEEMMSVTYDFDGDGTAEKVTNSYTYWSRAIGASGGKYFTADTDVKLAILSQIEYNLLNRYEFAVIGSYASVTLTSKKVKEATDTYNIMFGYGGIRYMTYNYSDAAWANYVSSNGGILNYE